MISLVIFPQISARSRHIELVHHFIRQLHARDILFLVHVPVKDMRADVLTEFSRFAARANLFSFTAFP